MHHLTPRARRYVAKITRVKDHQCVKRAGLTTARLAMLLASARQPVEQVNRALVAISGTPPAAPITSLRRRMRPTGGVFTCLRPLM
jgi:hypothetical protein